MQQENNQLNDAINKLKNFQKNIDKAAEAAEDVKNGNATAEEERQDPAYVLYNQIAETTVNIFKLPSTTKLFTELGEKMGEDTSQKLVELLAICMTHSAYQAVAWYDQLLKEELTSQFRNVGDHISKLQGDVKGFQGAMEVFKARLGKIEKQKKAESL